MMNEFKPDDPDWPSSLDFRVRPARVDAARPEGDAHAPAFGEVRFGPPVLGFRKEPAGACYRALLDFALSHCYAFSLAWRDDKRFDASAFELARRLEPWLCLERHASKWPGTELLGGKAWIRWYVVDRESVDLIRGPNRLYAWRSPALPEDLTFYRRDGRGWVGSIAHEEVGWLDATTFGPEPTAEIVARIEPYGVFA